MYSSLTGKMRIKDPSLLQLNLNETVCSGTGSNTGVLGLNTVNISLKHASVVV
jgi:hypothetical protein